MRSVVVALCVEQGISAMAKFSIRILLGMIGALIVSSVLASSLSIGQRAPDFALRSLDGEILRLSEFRSEVVVLNFWAPWCNKCRDAIHSLETIYQGNRTTDLHVLAVSVEHELDKAREFSDAQKATFPMLTDDAGNTVSRLYDLGKLPLTVLIGREGNVRFVHEGLQRDSGKQIEAQLNILLNE